eukprot:TRINITY_DN9178_c0_g1_i10.p1 TRINITY_DN9178_c0_g1~~TRINITY_DN9178_c0_g1_i10.p1  ORF type:complete len:399 (+),score=137.26 TRINITY_DN9178_c0_g1_i10:53-1249(+)
MISCFFFFFFFQAEDGIRDAQESRGLGDVYKRQYQRRVRGFPSIPMPSRERTQVVRFTYELAGIKKKKRGRKKKQELEVSKVVGAKKEGNKNFFKLRWKGFTPKDDTWEPATNCSCPKLISAFKEKEKKKEKRQKAVAKKKEKAKATSKATKPRAKKGTKKAARAKVTMKKAPAKRSGTKPARKTTATKPAKKAVAKSAAAEAVDEKATGVAGCEVVGEYNAKLHYINLEENSDKYFVIQVLAGPGQATYLYTRWGRSGTDGQQELTAMGRDDAIAGFKTKFKEKTGNEFGSDAPHQEGKYQSIITGLPALAPGVWEYNLAAPMDGMPAGWHPYHPSAIPIVEEVFVEWKNNPGAGLDVRCVQSGHYSYRVSFDKMQQTNLQTNKTRPIRRLSEQPTR